MWMRLLIYAITSPGLPVGKSLPAAGRLMAR